MMEQMNPLNCVRESRKSLQKRQIGTYSAAKDRTKPTDNLVLKSIRAFQRIRTGKIMNMISVRVLKTPDWSSVS